MAAPNHQEVILEAIESLRRRKARPDLERICHMVERRYGKTDLDIIGELDRLVDAEIVVKVEYKGSTSYRHAANWCKHRGYQLNSNDATRSILSAIEKLTVKNAPPPVSNTNAANKGRQAKNSAGGQGQSTPTPSGQDGRGARNQSDVQVDTATDAAAQQQVQGAKLAEVEKFFADSDPNTKFTRTYLEEALKREVDAKRLYISPTGEYVLAKYAAENAEQPNLTGKTKRSRLPLKQKRKRIKKTHGPEWEQESLVKTSVWELRCDYCTLPASCNKFGDREELLVCKDCTLKVHPSCMKYSKELAERSRLSPWQCIDCKTCHVCSDAGDPDTLLFCDSCDKGYHMACHNPSIEEKPSGKWVCELCAAEDMELGSVCTDEDSVISSESSGSLLQEDKKDAAQTSDQPGQVTPDVATPNPSMAANLPVQSSQSQQAGCSSAGASGKVNQKETTHSHPTTWSLDDVAEFFAQRGFGDEALTFKEQEIDGNALLLLRRSDVLTGLSFKLGRALKIYKIVSDIQLFFAKGNGIKGSSKSPPAPLMKSHSSSINLSNVATASSRTNKVAAVRANASKISPASKTTLQPAKTTGNTKTASQTKKVSPAEKAGTSKAKTSPSCKTPPMLKTSPSAGKAQSPQKSQAVDGKMASATNAAKSVSTNDPMPLERHIETGLTVTPNKTSPRSKTPTSALT